MKKKILIIEAIPHTPHLETAAEISILEKRRGHEVYFLWLGDNLPWHDWKIPFYKDNFGYTINKKISFIKEILSKEKIDIIKKKNFYLKDIIDWSKYKFKNQQELSSYKYKGINLGSGVRSSLISKLKDHNFCVKKNKNKIKNLLLTAAIIFEQSNFIIKKIKPTCIFTFNSRFAISRAIILAAKKNNTPVIRHERGANFKKYELYKKDLHDYDYRSKLVNDFWKKNSNKINKLSISKKFFISKRNGKDLFWISHTKNQIKNFYPKKIGNFRITFFSSSNYEFAAHLKKNHYWKSQFSAIDDILSIIKKKNIEFIVRLHPHLASNQNYKDRIELTNYLKEKCRIIKPDDPVDSYSLLINSDLIISYGSKISAEATFFKKPSISLRPTDYSDLNLTYEPKNKNQLKKLILNKKLKPKPYINAVKYGYYQYSFGINYKIYKPKNLFEGSFYEKNFQLNSLILKNLKIF